MSFEIDFTRLQDKQQLITFLGLDKAAFDDILSFDANRFRQTQAYNGIYLIDSRPFIKHEIQKKNLRHGIRIVWEPTQHMTTYKALSRRLANFFSNRLEGFPHPRCFGYVGGRNIRENAKDHCGNRHLVSVDIKEFFPSISSTKIELFLTSLGVACEVARPLSQFVTIGDKLALGLPTSPTIANAICLKMDIELQALAECYGATFSRYADDISFSGNGKLPGNKEIEKVIRQHDFTLAQSKTRRSTIGQAHFVTGLSVSDPEQPHVPKQKKRQLRQELYYAKKFGLHDHFQHIGIYNPEIIQKEINRLDGLVKFTAFQEPKLAGSLKTDWDKILQASGDRPSYQPKRQQRCPFFIFVDEAEFVRPNGGKVLALAMAVSQHRDQICQGVNKVLQPYLADPWAAGDREAAIKRGLHFAEAHPDLRLNFVERMRAMPFEGYVAFANFTDAEEYQATYLRLVNALIKRRLMAAESKFARFVFEKNDKVSQQAIKSTVMDTFNALRESNNRHPKNCFIEFRGKPHFGLSVPDFLLGVLKGFLELKPENSPTKPARDRLLFERLRDKYRLILDADNWIEYSRRKPLIPWREAEY